MAHGHHGLTVQVGHIQIDLQRGVQYSAELAEATAIHQKAYFHRFFRQCRSIYAEAGAVCQIHGKDPNREGNGSSQGFQLVLLAGDDPYLIKCSVLVNGLCKALAHAAGSAGDDCDFLHRASILSGHYYAMPYRVLQEFGTVP